MPGGAKNITENILPLIAWKPEFDLGIHIVDEQHRGILAIINTLHYEMQREQVDNVLVPVYIIIKEFTHIHFKVEEEFFDKFDYPDKASHCALHAELMGALYRIGEKSLINNDPNHFLDFLKNWWIHHICVKDREFRNYLLGE